MKKKILVGLAALAVIAGFSAFAATPSAQDAPLSNSYGQGYCYDGNDGYCQGPRRGGCYNGQNNCYNDNGYCQGPCQYTGRLSGLAELPGLRQPALSS